MGVESKLREARTSVELTYLSRQIRRDYMAMKYRLIGCTIRTEPYANPIGNIVPISQQRKMISQFMSIFNPKGDFAIELRQICKEAFEECSFQNLYRMVTPEFVFGDFPDANEAVEKRRETIILYAMSFFGEFVMLIDKTRHIKPAKQYLKNLYENEFKCFLPIYDSMYHAIFAVQDIESCIGCIKARDALNSAIEKFDVCRQAYINEDLENNNVELLLKATRRGY